MSTSCTQCLPSACEGLTRHFHSMLFNSMLTTDTTFNLQHFQHHEISDGERGMEELFRPGAGIKNVACHLAMERDHKIIGKYTHRMFTCISNETRERPSVCAAVEVLWTNTHQNFVYIIEVISGNAQHKMLSLRIYSLGIWSLGETKGGDSSKTTHYAGPYPYSLLACLWISCNHTPLYPIKYATRNNTGKEKPPLSTHLTAIILFIISKPSLSLCEFNESAPYFGFPLCSLGLSKNPTPYKIQNSAL